MEPYGAASKRGSAIAGFIFGVETWYVEQTKNL
jgi:hypothetical protein